MITTRAITPLTMVLGITKHVMAMPPPVSTGARAALALCREAERATGDTRRDLLERGLAEAEAAVQRAPDDPAAHFAVFCNLGRATQQAGISLAAVASIHRLRREIDRTLELAPDWVDALVGKGALLGALPRFLGGDPIEGEGLLRRAIELDPGFAYAHLELARLLAQRNREGEASAAAKRALAATAPGTIEAQEVGALLAQLER
jgi:tetratricopeptide (TPR) repeat protein